MQPESAHISSDLPQCFSIDPTDASVGPLSVGVQTQAEGLFMRQDRSPKGQDLKGLGSRQPARTPNCALTKGIKGVLSMGGERERGANGDTYEQRSNTKTNPKADSIG